MDSFSDVFYDRLKIRAQESPDKSYTAKLTAKGLDAVLKKVGEESAEFIIAAKNSGSTKEQISELADLYYHLCVAMLKLEIKPEDLRKELQSRFSQSGLEEKASRPSR